VTDASSNVTGLRNLVHTANRVVVLTGAGISAESGVPTFRGTGGLWRNYQAKLKTSTARCTTAIWESA
jgi:NAD-dependent SIR2 family protein deacetylase